jgi:uncharacterized membrane protein YdbT with pleckstrin-like domain
MEEFELEPGEKITRSVRSHWIVLLGELIPFVVLAILPLCVPIAFSFVTAVNPKLTSALNALLAQHAGWLFMGLGIWWLFIWICGFTTFTQYYLTTWIITTTRIVDIRQYSFFSRQVSSFLLNRVQDVTTDVEGFLPTMFNFGTLNVETAGRDEKFEMSGIMQPTELRDLIMQEVAALHADGSPVMPVPASGV